MRDMGRRQGTWAQLRDRRKVRATGLSKVVVRMHVGLIQRRAMPSRWTGLAPVAAAVVIVGWTMSLAIARPAAAQTEWWEQIPGFGSPNYSKRRERVQPAVRQEQAKAAEAGFADLRPNATPWMSDVMLTAMDQAIERHQAIVQRGGWRPVPGGRTIRPGDDDERIPAIKERLRATGDMAPSQSYFESLTLDESVERAVRAFQRRNGLRVTGRVDRGTLAAMNVSAAERLDQLRLNRRRIVEMMQPRVEDRYVLVNVPAFELEAVERYEVKQRHRVIVGREGRETPELKGQIKALNFFPFWRVPTSVATLDLIPRLQREPE